MHGSPRHASRLRPSLELGPDKLAGSAKEDHAILDKKNPGKPCGRQIYCNVYMAQSRSNP